MTSLLHKRFQKTSVEHALKVRRVLLLSGPRQCGKTTLAKSLNISNTKYFTLDDITILRAAEIDPGGFVKNHEGLLIIDEVQRVPLLLQAIKKAVDEDMRYGQYLLTGSANIQSLPGVTESLAGRIHKIRLRPLTQGEILGTEPKFLEDAFSQNFKSYIKCDKDQALSLAFRGGFPEAVALPESERAMWHRDYIAALLERDLKDIAKIQRHNVMQELLLILASWSSKLMDISSICSSLSTQRTTIESYINALEALYIVERVVPWIKKDYDRVGKKSKLFITDTGLMSGLLGWNIDQVRMDPDRAGKLVETFVFNELMAAIDLSNGKYNLSHYRDREKREIDFILERQDGKLLGIEVKAGSNVGEQDFKHLQWFGRHNKDFIGIVLYTGDASLRFGENFWAIPISALWE